MTKKPGRPPKVVPPIPDTFENVIKALVRPVKPIQPAKQDKRSQVRLMGKIGYNP